MLGWPSTAYRQSDSGSQGASRPRHAPQRGLFIMKYDMSQLKLRGFDDSLKETHGTEKPPPCTSKRITNNVSIRPYTTVTCNQMEITQGS